MKWIHIQMACRVRGQNGKTLLRDWLNYEARLFIGKILYGLHGHSALQLFDRMQYYFGEKEKR